MRMRTPLVILMMLVSMFAEGQSKDGKSLYGKALNALLGAGPSTDLLAAVDLLMQSAQLGYVPGQTATGYALETGFHVPVSPADAAEWYRKAAQQGDDTAAWLLGRMYFVGEIPGGEHEAEKWLRTSADAGNPFGAYLLALSLVDRDPKTAIPLFKAAAEKGLPYAQFQYAKSLTDGRAATVDKHLAYVWFMVSYDSGVKEAQTALQQLEADLGSTETDRAKSEARDLEPQVLRSNNAHGCTGWAGELDKVPSPPPLLDAICRST